MKIIDLVSNLIISISLLLIVKLTFSFLKKIRTGIKLTSEIKKIEIESKISISRIRDIQKDYILQIRLVSSSNRSSLIFYEFKDEKLYMTMQLESTDKDTRILKDSFQHQNITLFKQVLDKFDIKKDSYIKINSKDRTEEINNYYSEHREDITYAFKLYSDENSSYLDGLVTIDFVWEEKNLSDIQINEIKDLVKKIGFFEQTILEINSKRNKV